MFRLPPSPPLAQGPDWRPCWGTCRCPQGGATSLLGLSLHLRMQRGTASGWIPQVTRQDLGAPIFPTAAANSCSDSAGPWLWIATGSRCQLVVSVTTLQSPDDVFLCRFGWDTVQDIGSLCLQYVEQMRGLLTGCPLFCDRSRLDLMTLASFLNFSWPSLILPWMTLVLFPILSSPVLTSELIFVSISFCCPLIIWKAESVLNAASDTCCNGLSVITRVL
jgi:hypothetical protein